MNLNKVLKSLDKSLNKFSQIVMGSKKFLPLLTYLQSLKQN